jgi:hypothetical protein
MKGPTRRQSEESKKVETVNYYYQWQILKPSGKRTTKKNTVFVKTPKGTEEKDTLKDTTGMGQLRGSRDHNEPHTFVSINCMRAGLCSLKVSLNRFNFVSTDECVCGDRLQTKEHIFWDFKLYGDQRATTMNILSENSKKENPKSVTELLRLEEKRFVQGVCYFINKIPKLIKTKRSKCTKY